MKARATDGCPCGRPAPYASCCGRFIDGDEAAPDAESLMRSRYTAFVRGAESYLLATWHLSTRPAHAAGDPVKWLGLDVKSRRTTAADHAEVEFVARFRPAGPGAARRLHERSRFVREDGRWFYVDGEMLP